MNVHFIVKHDLNKHQRVKLLMNNDKNYVLCSETDGWFHIHEEADDRRSGTADRDRGPAVKTTPGRRRGRSPADDDMTQVVTTDDHCSSSPVPVQ
jgi:hypothetical protein